MPPTAMQMLGSTWEWLAPKAATMRPRRIISGPPARLTPTSPTPIITSAPRWPSSAGQVEAAAAFRRAVEADPGFVQAYFELGAMLRTLGQLLDSLACFQRTVELAPDHADA